MRLSVIIPAYNAEKIIGPTLKSVQSYLSKQAYDWEILVVNDGSKDNTAGAAEGLKSEIPNLKLLDNKENHGKGWVVKRGMTEAMGDWRLFMDDDNSTTIDHLDKFWPLTESCDVVIASIAVRGARVAKVEKFYRRLLGKLGNLWIQFWILPGIWDSQRGFKLFSAKAAQAIFPKLTISRWGFDVEALALARKFGFKIKEAPIHWRNEGQSRVKAGAYFQVLLEVLKIRWNLWTGKY